VSQIALPLSFDRQFSFDNYISANRDFIVTSLCGLINGKADNIVGLWGGTDCGKTHLLNACAHYAREQSVAFQLYEGTQLLEYESKQLGDVEPSAVLAVDNLDAICGHRGWEEKFYQLINQCRDQGARLLFALSSKPQDLICKLPDFQSRLSWGLLLELPSTDDSGVRQIVVQRAHLLGLELSQEVVSYLFTHYSRRLSDQMTILQSLDRASLRQQKKITIPLIKQVLAENPAIV